MLAGTREWGHAGFLGDLHAVLINGHVIAGLTGNKGEMVPPPDNRGRGRVRQPSGGVNISEVPIHIAVGPWDVDIDPVGDVVRIDTESGLVLGHRRALPEFNRYFVGRDDIGKARDIRVAV